MVVNGAVEDAHVRPDQRLVDILREVLGLSGTKIGCETGHCGACTVLLDGGIVCSCLVLAAECDGREVMTVEGLADVGSLNPVQSALAASTTIQCGYCIPGIVVAATALLLERPNPSEDDVREALVGNLCRCTGYHGYVRAIMAAARADCDAGANV